MTNVHTGCPMTIQRVPEGKARKKYKDWIKPYVFTSDYKRKAKKRNDIKRLRKIRKGCK